MFKGLLILPHNGNLGNNKVKLTKRRLQQIIKEEMDLESETKIPPQEILTNIIQKAINSLDIDYDSDWEDYSGGPGEISQKISEFAVELLDIMGNPEISVAPGRSHDEDYSQKPSPLTTPKEDPLGEGRRTSSLRKKVMNK